MAAERPIKHVATVPYHQAPSKVELNWNVTSTLGATFCRHQATKVFFSPLLCCCQCYVRVGADFSNISRLWTNSSKLLALSVFSPKQSLMNALAAGEMAGDSEILSTASCFFTLACANQPAYCRISKITAFRSCGEAIASSNCMFHSDTSF